MAATSKTYTRLTRDAAGVGSYASLWLAADHLVIARSTGLNESYTRLHLRDTKGFFLTKTDRRMWWGSFWGVIVGLSGIALVVTLTSGDTPIVSVIFFVLGVAGFLWNHFLGEGCRAYVVTGVQTAELPSLVRFPKTRKVFARLEPLIAQAQADLTVPPAMPAPVAERLSVPSEPLVSPAATDGAEAAPLRPEPPAAG